MVVPYNYFCTIICQQMDERKQAGLNEDELIEQIDFQCKDYKTGKPTA